MQKTVFRIKLVATERAGFPEYWLWGRDYQIPLREMTKHEKKH
jgi:hypothetical protein